jgi:hypothetical protein
MLYINRNVMLYLVYIITSMQGENMPHLVTGLDFRFRDPPQTRISDACGAINFPGISGHSAAKALTTRSSASPSRARISIP